MRIYLFGLLFFFSCINNTSENNVSTSVKLDSLKLSKKQVELLRVQVNEYLQCTSGNNIDSVSKYVYNGSLKQIMDQDPSIKSESIALVKFKSFLRQTKNEIDKLKISFDYDVQNVDRALKIKNVSIVEFKVITKAIRQNRLLGLDTTVFLALANNDQRNWNFLNKTEAKTALTYEFLPDEISAIFNLNTIKR